MQPKRLFIVDAMALAFRSHYAFAGRPLTTKSGLPTSAVFGCAMFMNKLIAEQRPDYLVVASDAQAKTFRHELYSGYKANRKAMPEDLAAQLPTLFRLFAAYGVPLLREPGLEADDLIGTLARRFAADDLHVYIVSGDKDFMQLIDERTFLLRPKKGDESIVIDRAGVVEYFGVGPEQVIDCLAIIGDASDNVPGVHGIGEKGAAKLVLDHGSLDAIYANLESIANAKHRNALTEHRASAFLSRQLVTIKTDCTLGLELTDLALDPDAASRRPELVELFHELEFRALADRADVRRSVTIAVATDLGAAPAGAGDARLALAERPAPERIPDETPGYALVDRPERLAELVAALEAVSAFAFDSETTGLDRIDSRPIGLSFSTEPGRAWYLPIVAEHLGKDEGALTPAAALDAVRPLLADAGKTKIGHNVKFDLQMLANAGVPVSGPFVDTMIADWLLDPAGRQHGLDPCCLRHLNYEKIPTSTLIGKKGELPMLEAPLPELTRYACEDADLTLRLAHRLLPLIEGKGLLPVLRDVEMPLIPVLAHMEQTGVYIDTKVLSEASTRLGALVERLEQEVHKAAETEFNVNSPKQLGDVLFNQLKLHEQLGIKGLKKTQSGFSTDESVLQRMAAHPLPRAILEYRGAAKLKGTYVDALPQLVHPQTHRLHTSFHQTGTATGRLSSSDPNLQNIPIRSPEGQEIRRAFRAQQPGWVIVSADYSQIELRILAHLAGEAALAAAFAAGEDIHTMTAARIFGVEAGGVDPVLRSRAKAINFGIIYGMGPRRLAAETGVSMAEATQFIDRYFATYPKINEYIDKAIADARAHGYATTITGRRRPIDGLFGRGAGVAAAENIAVNSPIQGSAADLIKLAMIRIDEALRVSRLEAKLVLQVHDELVLECPERELDAVERIVRNGMQHAMELSVPLAVEIGHGPSWLEAH
jgi:DNA polymerase-1